MLLSKTVIHSHPLYMPANVQLPLSNIKLQNFNPVTKETNNQQLE
jgi:hypothetical protein